MPASSSTPLAPGRLLLRDASRMGATALQPHLEAKFENLVTAAVADATGHLPRSSHKLLHGPRFRDNLADALQWAEAELQVSSEWLQWTKDPRADRATRELRHVRVALQQAREESTDRRRTQSLDPTRHTAHTDSAAIARLWLHRAMPDRFHTLLAQEYAAQNLEPIEPRTQPTDIFEAIEAGCARGYLLAATAPALNDLLDKAPADFRTLVANDARRQDHRTVQLRHPLALRRWRHALDELAEITAPLARASSPTVLGPLTADLDALPKQAAYGILNARRFLVALQQRTTECTRTAAQYAQTSTEREQADPANTVHHQLHDQAQQHLGDEHPAAYHHIRNRLRPHETAPGRIDPDALNSEDREALMHQVLTELHTAAVPGADRRTAIRRHRPLTGSPLPQQLAAR